MEVDVYAKYAAKAEMFDVHRMSNRLKQYCRVNECSAESLRRRTELCKATFYKLLNATGYVRKRVIVDVCNRLGWDPVKAISPVVRQSKAGAADVLLTHATEAYSILSELGWTPSLVMSADHPNAATLIFVAHDVPYRCLLHRNVVDGRCRAKVYEQTGLVQHESLVFEGLWSYQIIEHLRLKRLGYGKFNNAKRKRIRKSQHVRS